MHRQYIAVQNIDFNRRNMLVFKTSVKMAGGDSKKLCVKCKKVIDNTETVLVCGLWCRKSFHNKCLGVSDSEARAVTCSKLQIKFHCETCENRLGVELFEDKEPQQPKNVEKCVNSCVNLLDLVQKLVKLTTEVSNDNSAINSKLDIVLRSNAKLEEYLLQSPKRFEKRSEEAHDNSLVCVESDSSKRITEIREQNDNTNVSTKHINNNQISWCTSEIQQTDKGLFIIGRDFPEQSADSRHPCRQQNIAENSSPNDLEEPDGNDSSKESQTIVKVECSQSEDFEGISTLITEKSDDEEEENAVIEAGMKRLSSTEVFVGPSTFRTENAEDDEAEEVEKDDNLQDIKYEVELTIAGSEQESSIPVVMEGSKSGDDSRRLVTNISLAAIQEERTQQSTKLDAEMYDNQTHLQRRKGVHSCTVCHKTFRTNSNLKEHFRCHTGERPYRCNICNKAFGYSSNLKQHLLVHTDGSLYRCSICDKEFRLSMSLKQHMRLHTGERLYRCSICNKVFIRSSNLKQHLRVHTGERPYRCSICNKAFSQFSSMHRHVRLHTGDRPHECSVCGKAFVQSMSLKRHLMLHTG